MKSLETRINEKLTKKDGTLKEIYNHIFDVIDNPKDKHRIHKWTRSGRHNNLTKLMGRIQEALYLIGVEFEIKNDAPMGGQNGDYLALTPKGVRQTGKLRAKRMRENN